MFVLDQTFLTLMTMMLTMYLKQWKIQLKISVMMKVGVKVHVSMTRDHFMRSDLSDCHVFHVDVVSNCLDNND